MTKIADLSGGKIYSYNRTTTVTIRNLTDEKIDFMVEYWDEAKKVGEMRTGLPIVGHGSINYTYREILKMPINLSIKLFAVRKTDKKWYRVDKYEFQDIEYVDIDTEQVIGDYTGITKTPPVEIDRPSTGIIVPIIPSYDPEEEPYVSPLVVIPETGEKVGAKITEITSSIKNPFNTESWISAKTKAILTIIAVFFGIILLLAAVGYSGMGGSVGRVAEKEHGRRR